MKQNPYNPNEFVWKKKGGYADAKIKGLIGKLKASGWKRENPFGSNSPDGNTIVQGDVWSKGRNQVIIRSSFGAVASSNYFEIIYKIGKG